MNELKPIAEIGTDKQVIPFNPTNQIKRKVGQPLIFKTAKELKVRIDKYFEIEDKPTLAGLAYYLGIDRQTLYNYKKREAYFDIIKMARDHIEYIYEQRLLYSDKPTGVIFALKNMNWTDRQIVEQTTEHIVPIMSGSSKDVTPPPVQLKSKEGI